MCLPHLAMKAKIFKNIKNTTSKELNDGNYLHKQFE